MWCLLCSASTPEDGLICVVGLGHDRGRGLYALHGLLNRCVKAIPVSFIAIVVNQAVIFVVADVV